MERCRYDAMRPHLRTGDVLLFSGGSFVSFAIKVLTGSKWSHVGMVYRTGDVVLLWESTTLSDVADVEHGTARRGVQLVPLSDRLARYDGDVAVRRLEAGRLPDKMQALETFRRHTRETQYERSVLELARSLGGPRVNGHREDLSSLFCSELLAESYQVAGWLPPGLASNSFRPVDFSAEGTVDGLLLGARLGKEVLLTP